MVYLFLVISLVLNGYFIFKYNKLKKTINDYFCSDKELEDMLDRL